MDPKARVGIGRTSLKVSRLGFGCVPLGGLYEDLSEDQADATVCKAFDLGVNYFDVAPIYGFGKAETRLGRILSQRKRESFVVATKIGYSLVADTASEGEDVFHRFANVPPLRPIFDYSYDGIMKSVEGSLQRLKLERIDILNIHDPDDHWKEAIDVAYPTLHKLRTEGVVEAIGVGMNQADMLARFAREADFDCMLVAGRYTLIDHIALHELLPVCEKKGISVIIGGPFNSGILVTGARPGSTFNYVPASQTVMERVAAIEQVCNRHHVPLGAAALQFPMAHPAVTAIIPGARSASEVEQNVRHFSAPIPNEFWLELRNLGLLPSVAPIPQFMSGSERA